jgi:cell division protein FtsW
LTLQAAINLAVITASVPTKGIPLPFVSFGGSGLCVTLVQVGILLSIDRLNKEAVE